jgi:cytochrome c biogenesis protein CcdA
MFLAVQYFDISLFYQNDHTMKKLVSNSNPFILLLAPVVFAIIMGVSYQFEQRKDFKAHATTEQATSLFFKGVSMVKTVCSIAKDNVW